MNNSLITPNKRSRQRKWQHDSDSPLYVCWHNMLSRCYRQSHPSYARYGGRGIQVCEQWRSDYDRFCFDVMAEIGPRPAGKSLDRKDNDGNYRPGNIKWSTAQEQQCNRTLSMPFPERFPRPKAITADGQTRSLTDWAEHSGIKLSTIAYRLRSGWSEKDAVTVPSRQWKPIASCMPEIIPPRPSKMETDARRLADLVQSGATDKEIEAQLGVKHRYVVQIKYLARKLGFLPAANRHPAIKRVLDLRAQGLSITSIAVRLNRAPCRIKAMLSKAESLGLLPAAAEQKAA